MNRVNCEVFLGFRLRMFVHKVLMFYFFSISLSVFVMLKLDGPTDWSWFLVLTPMWLLDGVLLVLATAQVLLSVIPVLESYVSSMERPLSKWRSFWFLAFVCCKVAFQILLCLKGDSIIHIPLSLVMIPLWLVLCGVCIDLSHSSYLLVEPSVKEFWQERKKSKTESDATFGDTDSNAVIASNPPASSEAVLGEKRRRPTDFTNDPRRRRVLLE